ncbi:hypothetical protein HOK51_02305 [Candidatus Woesearchaeota archaeon]|jgi:hypothetical protein|nr:hypothetical protein [Candidatus Woesearchaeota archaeon]MBT6518649.1 hypothetical protein [Candidatus Woesearchaeota archaeon]MBT7368705.1 hypothetical protein [Candidatus Woesearchaeota archaeon]
MNYLTLNQIIEKIDEPNRAVCYRVLEDNKDLFTKASGSTKKHHAWEGGYLDHVVDTCNIAVALYAPLNKKRKLNFSLSDVFLTLFLHDVEKAWKYEPAGDGTWKYSGRITKENEQEFREEIIRQYGFQLSDEHINAIEFAEGEGKKWKAGGGRLQKPLAAFVHCCDTISARVWHDNPTGRNDSWSGDYRVNKHSK